MSTTDPRPSPDTEVAGVGGLWRVVAWREIMVRAREKSFIIGALVSMAILLVSIVGIDWYSARDQDRTVAIVDQVAVQVVDDAGLIAASINERLTVTSESYADVAAAEEAVSTGEVDAALLLTDNGYEIVGDSDVDSTLSQALTAAASSSLLSQNAAELGVDLAALQDGSQATERLLDPATDNEGLRQIAAVVFAVLFLFIALGFGMSIAGSVTQEKESRVVEILAATVPIRHLLWGKVAGNTVLALSQVVSLVAAGALGLVITGQTSGLAAIGPAMIWYIVFFVIGFVALASLWSIAGSMASRQQDLQSTTLPAQMVLFVPYFAAIAAGERVQEILSMVPIISTMLMPSRLAEGDVPAWQIAVAIVGTILTAVILVRVATAVFERTVLRTGNKISYREAFIGSGTDT